MTRFIALMGVLAVLVCTVVAARPAAAQGTVQIIEQIRVEGNQRIEADTVRSYLEQGGVIVGGRMDREIIDRGFKELFATSLFADINLRREGGTLVVTVVENPIINRLAFEGNKRISDEILEAEVRLRPRIVFTRDKVKSDVARILEIYRRSGRFATTVDAKVIQQAQNRVDLVFEIEEGPLTSIRKISFIGNRRISDGALKRRIRSKEDRWYCITCFLSGEGTYDPDRLTFDRELLRRHIGQRGMPNFASPPSLPSLHAIAVAFSSPLRWRKASGTGLGLSRSRTAFEVSIPRTSSTTSRRVRAKYMTTSRSKIRS